MLKIKFFKFDAEGYFGHSAIYFQRPAIVVEDGENDYDDDEGKESEGEGYIDEDLMNID